VDDDLIVPSCVHSCQSPYAVYKCLVGSVVQRVLSHRVISQDDYSPLCVEKCTATSRGIPLTLGWLCATYVHLVLRSALADHHCGTGDLILLDWSSIPLLDVKRQSRDSFAQPQFITDQFMARSALTEHQIVRGSQ
jgi:hypothetical protein